MNKLYRYCEKEVIAFCKEAYRLWHEDRLGFFLLGFGCLILLAMVLFCAFVVFLLLWIGISALFYNPLVALWIGVGLGAVSLVMAFIVKVGGEVTHPDKSIYSANDEVRISKHN